MLRFASMLVCCGLIAGCGGSPAEFDFVQQSPDGASLGSVTQVLVATPRNPVDDPRFRFGRGRSDTLSYADIRVWVPNNRKPGSIKTPKGTADPRRDFAITEYAAIDGGGDFLKQINADLARLPEEDRDIFFFVHGYNVPFTSGVYRHAQMKHDYNAGAVAVHYSWPSAGEAPAYLYDRDSVQYARDGLEQTLELLTRSNAQEIFVVAHSMGTLLTMEAFRQLSLRGKTRTLGRLGPLVLASPDIDEDVFKRQVEAIHPVPKPFVIFTSEKDRALRLSSQLRGGAPRVGQGKHIEALREMGIVVVNLTDIEDTGDSVNHSTFASSPTVVSLVASGALGAEALHEEETAATSSSASAAAGDLVSSIVLAPIRVVSEAAKAASSQ